MTLRSVVQLLDLYLTRASAPIIAQRTDVMPKQIIPLILCTLIACALPQEEAMALPKFKLKGKWKLIKSRGHSKVYQMKVRGSRLIAMRGDTIYNAPIGKVMHLLSNVPRKVKWVSRMIQARYVEKKSPDDYIVYTRFKFPWPTSHRDFLLRTQCFYYPKEKKIIRYQYSIKDARVPPKKGVIRAVIHYSRYTLVSIANGTKTRMSAIGYGDPKGSIPSFIVNFIQRRWPMKNMKSITEQLKKPHVIDLPRVKKKLNPPPPPRPAPRPAPTKTAPRPAARPAKAKEPAKTPTKARPSQARQPAARR